jgi:hypothetical protein
MHAMSSDRRSRFIDKRPESMANQRIKTSQHDNPCPATLIGENQTGAAGAFNTAPSVRFIAGV